MITRCVTFLLIGFFSSFSYSGYNAQNFTDYPGQEECRFMNQQGIKLCTYVSYTHNFTHTMSNTDIKKIIGGDVSYIKIFPLQVNSSAHSLNIQIRMLSRGNGNTGMAIAGYDEANPEFSKVDQSSFRGNITIPAKTPIDKPYIIPFANNLKSAGALANMIVLNNTLTPGFSSSTGFIISARFRDSCTINVDSSNSGTIYFGDTFPSNAKIASQTGKDPSKFTVNYSGYSNKKLKFSNIILIPKPSNFTGTGAFKLYTQDADLSESAPVTEASAPIALDSVFNEYRTKNYNVYLYSVPSADKSGKYIAKATIICTGV